MRNNSPSQHSDIRKSRASTLSDFPSRKPSLLEQPLNLPRGNSPARHLEVEKSRASTLSDLPSEKNYDLITQEYVQPKTSQPITSILGTIGTYPTGDRSPSRHSSRSNSTLQSQREHALE